MTEENTGISQQAHDRVTGERDKFKSQVTEQATQIADAQAALSDFAKIDTAYEHFAGKDLPNAYGLAREAILNPQVKAADKDTIGEALDGWHTHQVSIFGAPAAAEPGAETEPAVAPVAPMSQPNPAAPGTSPIGGAPTVIGTAEYQAKYGALSRAEQRAAHDRGETVFSPEVQAAQATIPTV